MNDLLLDQHSTDVSLQSYIEYNINKHNWTMVFQYGDEQTR